MSNLIRRAMIAGSAIHMASGQAAPTGMTLRERVAVADFIGLVRVLSTHPFQEVGGTEDEGPKIYLQTADAVVLETIKGAHIPPQVTINFELGPGNVFPGPKYEPNKAYLVFMGRDPGGRFSTCEQGQYELHDSTVSGWQQSTSPVPLDVIRSDILNAGR